MKILLSLIRAVLLMLVVAVVALVVTVGVAIGGLILLLTGRRPQFRIYRPRDFGDPMARPPMKDVTPRTIGAHEPS